MSEFAISTKLYFGDCLGQVLESARRVFIVTDGFMHDSGIVDYVTGRLAPGAQHEMFYAVKADPDIDTVTAGTAALIAFGPDAVVAFGGGSPIDAAKAMVYFAGRAGGLGKCAFIAVPTTSGTGSEVSKFSVITDTEKQIKYPLVDDSLMPDTAVLDAALVVTAPPSITADTGMDVFTHAVEAYVSTGTGDFARALAEKAVELVAENLPVVYREPDNLEARQKMHNASCMAGAAFSNAGLGLVHAMAHALGGRFHIPHGRANAILLPYVMSFNAGCTETLTGVAAEYARLASGLGMGATSTRQSALNLIRWVRRTSEKLGIPATIGAAGVDREEFHLALDSLTEAATGDRCFATNPVAATAEEVAGVFRKAFSGKLP